MAGGATSDSSDKTMASDGFGVSPAIPSFDTLEKLAQATLRLAEEHDYKIATCESCTGGLISSLLTDVEGLSHAFERGLVVYTDQAKIELLGISEEVIRKEGPVSEITARAMAQGALEKSRADIAVSITGFAGPAGEDDEVGLVFVGCATSASVDTVELHCGDIGRTEIRHCAAATALQMMQSAMQKISSLPSQ